MTHDRLGPKGESDCQIVEELLSAFYDEELNDGADTFVRHHLDACTGCTGKLEEIKATVVAINSLPREATPEEDLWPGVAEHAGLVPVVDPGGRRSWQTPLLAAAAVVAVLVTGVGGVAMLLDGNGPPRASRGTPVIADAVPQPDAPAPPAAPRAPVSPELAARAVNELIRATTDPNARVRLMAVQALGEQETERAIPALIRALLNDADVEVRRQAAWALGEIESPRPDAIAALGRALREDGDVEVQRMAIWALGEIEHSESAPELLAALGNENAELRSMAVWALGEIESAVAVEGLVNVLRTDPSAEVRHQAAWALGEIESSEAVTGLVFTLRNDADAEVRLQSAWALGEIESTSPQAIDAMSAALANETEADVRKMIVWAFGEIESSRALDALVTAMQDADAEVRAMAMWAIAEIGN